MKIFCNSVHFFSENQRSKFSFKGTPQKIYGMDVRNYQDALKYWEVLKSAKYLDAHCNSAYDKFIRKENYSFLDKLTSYYDKSNFVEKFCDYTGFPNLRNISDKIDSVFKNCMNQISYSLNRSNYNSPYDIIDFGYDPTCSLGLRKAFPGSDLDKGYIIIRGNEYESKNGGRELVDNFKGELWENLDQRIVSLNHPNTEISIYTKKQIEDMLSSLDEKAAKVEKDLLVKQSLGTLAAMAAASPFMLIDGGALAGLLLAKYFKKPYVTTDPYEAGKFNRKLASKIVGKDERENAKNFAFFIEIVRANLKRKPFGKSDSIFSRIKESPFAQNSNVTQGEAWQNKINNGYLKSKLRNRMQLESDFYSMSTDTKYDLVKDVIKYGTDDQGSRFSQYFKNDDDIANRYERLLQSLK